MLSRVEGVTVLIHDQECAAELRGKRKRRLAADPAGRVVINQRVCEGCGDCGEKSNCLSVQPIDTDFGRKTVIDQSSCNKDYSCLKGDCPSFLTVIPSAKLPGRRAAVPALASDGIPDPALRFDVAAAPHTTRITGVGGTGVVDLVAGLEHGRPDRGPSGSLARSDRTRPEGGRGHLRRQDQCRRDRAEQQGRGGGV